MSPVPVSITCVIIVFLLRVCTVALAHTYDLLPGVQLLFLSHIPKQLALMVFSKSFL
jgi:hypothetical protein